MPAEGKRVMGTGRSLPVMGGGRPAPFPEDGRGLGAAGRGLRETAGAALAAGDAAEPTGGAGVPQGGAAGPGGGAGFSRSGVPGGVWLVTDRRLLAEAGRLSEVAAAALEAGVAGVQLREKDLPARRLCALAEELALLVRKFRRRRGPTATEPVLVVNDRVDVALAAGADGVHLGSGSLPAGVVRALVPRGFLVGVSVHRVEELSAAAAAGADYAVFGTVFPSPSKKGVAPHGVQGLARACRAAALPVLAIGGMTAGRLAAVRAAGAHGVCVVSALMAAPDPRAAADALVMGWAAGAAAGAGGEGGAAAGEGGASLGRGSAGEGTLVRVRVNGEEMEVPDGLTVAGLLGFLRLPGEGVAVERNLEIVRRAEWELVTVAAGDSFEIVRAVGGG